jgi:hypothetical protein
MTMKSKQRAPSATTKRRVRRLSNLEQIEERFALLLLLLQHNFNKVLQHKKR